jgi:hypothetical protein
VPRVDEGKAQRIAEERTTIDQERKGERLRKTQIHT